MSDKAIYAAMASIQSELGAIEKNQRNAAQNFQYRGIDDVYQSLSPLLAKNGVFVLPEVLDVVRESRVTAKGAPIIFTWVKVKYNFVAADGSSVSCVSIGEGFDSGDKSIPKALAIAQKYAIFQTFLPPVKQIDPDADSVEIGHSEAVETRVVKSSGVVTDGNDHFPPMIQYGPGGADGSKALDKGIEDEISAKTLAWLKKKWDEKMEGQDLDQWYKTFKREVQRLNEEDRKVLRVHVKK